jgi:SAM-dependent methyltransferase
MGAAANGDRKRRGAWFTPDHLVDTVVAAVIDEAFVAARAGRMLRVLDPACGDGRFLTAALAAIRACGADAVAFGVDVDAEAVDFVERNTEAVALLGDALHSQWLDAQGATFDLVIGNPPYLSQMAATTTRGGSSRHGGGPYADAAAEFLSLAAGLVDPNGGRLAFVLPQSILSARDAAAARTRIDERATMFWSSWTGERDFDADVFTCAVAFEFGESKRSNASSKRSVSSWSHVVTERVGIPPMPSALDGSPSPAGSLGDRAVLNANFRDEYYGMIPAVGDHDTGPPLVTSGLIDPGRVLWGEIPVRFAKRRFAAPRIDVDALDVKMRAWADKRLVPKVLVANQTPIIEAVCDPTGEWLPGVPVVAVYPRIGVSPWEIAAVLTSPSTSVWAWHQHGGSGLSPNTIRISPVMLAKLAWPPGSLTDAVAALQAGDVIRCGQLVDEAYGLTIDEQTDAMTWWKPILDRIVHRKSRTEATVTESMMESQC